ncbi:hypothetical protein AB0G71_05880 [Streptomyces sp. NPDC020403]|uniref:hypothetical protein n=1 Tax=unclassified Streptomyces TaxID=2593676 RepID=UPI00340EA02E
MVADPGQEWGSARTGGAGPGVGTQLNGIPPEPSRPGGSVPDFASTPAQKKTAANTVENELEPSTKKAADHADEATAAARKGFGGWETASGLKTVADTWDQQVKTLMGRLAAEKNALRGASGLFADNDTGVGNQLLSQSKLSNL